MSMTDKLFVYGTLRRDAPSGRSTLLGPGAEFVGYARMPGHLLDLGRFPGFVPVDDRRWSGQRASEGSLKNDPSVRGELYALTNPARTLPRLDRYEGCGPDDPEPHLFERMERTAVLESGGERRAWVYIYRGPTVRGSEIPSGDYAEIQP